MKFKLENANELIHAAHGTLPNAPKLTEHDKVVIFNSYQEVALRSETFEYSDSVYRFIKEVCKANNIEVTNE